MNENGKVVHEEASTTGRDPRDTWHEQAVHALRERIAELEAGEGWQVAKAAMAEREEMATLLLAARSELDGTRMAMAEQGEALTALTSQARSLSELVSTYRDANAKLVSIAHHLCRGG